jgi:hypothetical protein
VPQADRNFPEFGQDGPEHLILGDVGIENERGVVVDRIEFIQKPPAERGLAAADFADQKHESLLLLDAILEVLQCLLVRRAQIEKLRVWGDVKRHLRETVETLIHDAE